MLRVVDVHHHHHIFFVSICSSRSSCSLFAMAFIRMMMLLSFGKNIVKLIPYLIRKHVTYCAGIWQSLVILVSAFSSLTQRSICIHEYCQIEALIVKYLIRAIKNSSVTYGVTPTDSSGFMIELFTLEVKKKPQNSESAAYEKWNATIFFSHCITLSKYGKTNEQSVAIKHWEKNGMCDTTQKKNQRKSVLSGLFVCVPIDWIVKVFFFLLRA